MPQIRDDFETLKAQAARGAGSGLQATTFLAMTDVEHTYPTVANRFYMVQPLAIAGDETEGASATMVGDLSQRSFAYNIGGSVPPLNTKVVVFSVANRQVFTYG